MKHNKFLILTGAFLLMLSVLSCTKKLDEVVPQDTISKDQALKDPNAARTLYHGGNAFRYLG